MSAATVAAAVAAATRHRAASTFAAAAAHPHLVSRARKATRPADARPSSTLAAAAAASCQPRADSPAPGAPRRIVVESCLAPVQVPDETLPEYLWRKNAALSEEPCISCAVSGRSLTFGELRDTARRWAVALLSAGLRPGDMLALLVPNLPEFVVALHGALMAGLRVTMANPLYTAEELSRQFSDAGAKAAVTVTPLLATARAAMGPSAPIVVVDHGGKAGRVDGPVLHWQAVLDTADAKAGVLPAVDPSSVAVVPYSSGTTGLPKGVQLTHRNLVANITQMDVPELKHVKETTNGVQERLLTVLPFFHIYGFNGVLNLGLAWGAHTVTMPAFEPEAYLKALKETEPSILFVVPSLLQFLAAHPKVTASMLRPVRAVVSGAAPVTQALLEKFRKKCERDDLFITQGYGMTELSPVTLLSPRGSPPCKEVSLGRLLPNTKARVLKADGSDAGPTETGELLVQGPQVMKGYLNNEEATLETIDEEGWLHTGDVVYYDEENYFYIVDRTKELIKVKGNQVSPTELENLIMELPEVADCAVVGIPDERYDEVPRAFVVLHPNKTLSEEQIKKHIEPRVVKYKHLAGGVIYLDKIPRNASGKILRTALKKWKPQQ